MEPKTTWKYIIRDTDTEKKTVLIYCNLNTLSLSLLKSKFINIYCIYNL